MTTATATASVAPRLADDNRRLMSMSRPRSASLRHSSDRLRRCWASPRMTATSPRVSRDWSAATRLDGCRAGGAGLRSTHAAAHETARGLPRDRTRPRAEPGLAVRRVAKRLAARPSAAAQHDAVPGGQFELVPLDVDDANRPRHLERAVVANL